MTARESISAHLQTLAAAAAVPGVDLVLVTDRLTIGRVRDLVVAGNGAQLADAAFVRELRSWLRFSPRQAIEAGDGLFSASSGNPALPRWIGPLLFDMVFRAGPENDKYARQLNSSAGIAIFASERNDRDHWHRAGRACQRFALQATALGLKHVSSTSRSRLQACAPSLPPWPACPAAAPASSCALAADRRFRSPRAGRCPPCWRPEPGLGVSADGWADRPIAASQNG